MSAERTSCIRILKGCKPTPGHFLLVFHPTARTKHYEFFCSDYVMITRLKKLKLFQNGLKQFKIFGAMCFKYSFLQIKTFCKKILKSKSEPITGIIIVKSHRANHPFPPQPTPFPLPFPPPCTPFQSLGKTLRSVFSNSE